MVMVTLMVSHKLMVTESPVAAKALTVQFVALIVDFSYMKDHRCRRTLLLPLSMMAPVSRASLTD